MEITIQQSLKKLRHDKGNTQEELATHLGVTVQAVSRWERGEGWPDLAHLPAIAFYYSVTVDDLLGVGELKKSEKLGKYFTEHNALAHEGKNDEVLTLWREAHREFPNEPGVMQQLMYAIYSVYSQKSDEDKTREEADGVIALCERMLRETTDDTILHESAIQILCYINLCHLKDKAKAQEYARMAPSGIVTQGKLMPRTMEGDAAVSYHQLNLMQGANEMWLDVCGIVEQGKYGDRDALRADTRFAAVEAALRERARF
ncbi:MAG: helix-turn-helix domain-containing protein [Oscillospiraceae bacterium]|nr:helix-turn-helix domain-containing protein [Oscillospiraceae bacterium]